ncbi:MAG: hypothetical protein LBH25_10895 [Fibromonadaceae bacterium]|nr:hypothetical protein [Fibromonadaceae bacterium]
MRKIYTWLALLLVCAYAQERQPIVLYMNGSFSAIDYHLGVLSEIERLKIPIDSIVASDWGVLAGALWSAGWNAEQIRDWVKSLEPLQHAKQPQNTALWQKSWLIKHSEDGKPQFENYAEKRPYFGQEFFDLQIQEAYWRSDIGSKIPFREIGSAEAYPFPPLSESIIRIFSNPVALRDTNGNSAERYQMALWNRDTTLIMLRPHSKPNPDSLFRVGVHAVQNKRSQLASLLCKSGCDKLYLSSINPARFLYLPVFDSVPAELQGHLESFWNKKDTGSLAVKNFLEALQKDGSYQNVKLAMDTSSLLQINAQNNSALSLSLRGIGGSFLGANAAANINFRFLSQFTYNLDLNAFYGQGIKGFVPELKFERFFMDNGNFFAKLKLLEFSPTSYFQKSIELEARILNEKTNNMIFGVEKPLGAKSNKPVLIIAVEREDRDIVSGASKYAVDDGFDFDDFDPDDFDPDNWDWLEPRYEYETVTVRSIFPYAKWIWQSEDYDRWFSTDGFMAELMGGFKAVSISLIGQDAPLYVSTQGKINITHPFSKYFSLMAGTEFGANFRRIGQNTFVIRPALSDIKGNNQDPALDNRWRFAMGMGMSQEQWQSPVNASNLYGLIMSSLALHVNGNGFFLAAGFAKDGEANPWAQELSQKRLFAEPKIRIRTSAFDFVAGQSIVYFSGIEEKKSFFFEFRGIIP